MESSLPIDAALPALRAALRAHRSAVVQAPPGAGKTTRVPLALLDEPWARDGRIVMLEPRRLAARAAAAHMARLLGDEVGGIVGYRIRNDTRVSARTRIEVVTEGVLTRMLQSDPALEGVAALIFDEFHERSLHADVGLALALDARAQLREELRILAMSATLEVEGVARLLEAPVVASTGRVYPVETHYLRAPLSGHVEPAAARAVLHALRVHDGDVLVFLPGAAEIARTRLELESAGVPGAADVFTLHGQLEQREQDRAIAPAPAGRRKVVLATAVAETSLTIEGVRVVVDSGWMRVPRFSPRSGMTRLATVRITRASAEQRRGRAGRTAPGDCYRLWTEAEDAQLVERGRPEILEADLAPLALELAAWGPAELRWLDPPPAAALAQARALLAQLGALDAEERLTGHGRAMARLGAHPRLAHMLLAGRARGLGRLAAELAALLGERDVLRGEDADLRLRVEAVRAAAQGRAPSSIAGMQVDGGALRRVVADARRWSAQQAVPGDVDEAGALLAQAYPDRIAQRRTGVGARYLLRNGRGASLAGAQSLVTAEYLVAAELAERETDSRIFLAAPITLEEIERDFAQQIERENAVEWDTETGAVRARTRARLGALVLRDAPARDVPPEHVTRALLRALRAEGTAALPWTDESRRLQQRLLFLRSLDESFPDATDEALLADLDAWLAPRVEKVRTRAELRRVDLSAALLDRLDWQQRRRLEEWAPTHVQVPSGSRVPIDYADAAAPVVAVRLQEIFGLRETPRIAGGRVPLTMQLLSPARRVVQVTRDLASFWKDAYFEVRKDLRGRYPKHEWPEDPLTATPTARAKRR